MSAACMENSNIVRFPKKNPKRKTISKVVTRLEETTNLTDVYVAKIIPALPLAGPETTYYSTNSHSRKLNTLHPDGLSLADITLYLEDHHARCKPQSTRNLAFGLFRCVKQYFHGVYEVNLSLKFTVDQTFEKWKRLKRRPTPRKVPTLREVMRLIDEANEEDSVMIEFLFYSALRNQELCNLRIDNFDREIGPDGGIGFQVRVKGGDLRYSRIHYSSFEKARRVFKGDVYLFERQPGNRQFNRHAVGYRMDRACEAVFGKGGLRFTPHAFRHAFARWIFGHSPEKLHAILKHGGWKEVQTFITTYHNDTLAATDIPTVEQIRLMLDAETGLPVDSVIDPEDI